MRKISLVILVLMSSLYSAEELKIKALSFQSDEAKGISTFRGNVEIKKGSDELNASEVLIYTSQNRKPTKFVLDGNVSFYVTTENNSTYRGTAGKVIYTPDKKEYEFLKNVNLEQIDEHKAITGERVMVNMVDGKAFAEGKHNEPVIMTFTIETNATGIQ